jgi:hypothetical protein
MRKSFAIDYEKTSFRTATKVELTTEGGLMLRITQDSNSGGFNIVKVHESNDDGINIAPKATNKIIIS